MAERKSNDGDSYRQTHDSSSADDDAAQESCDISSDDRPQTSIRPVTEKIGESDDNLRSRGEWYRRRTGGA